MHQSELSGTPDQFTLILHTKKVPVFITATFVTFGTAIFLVPLFVTVFAGFNPSILPGIALAGFLAFRLIRIALWNAYGREIVTYKEGVMLHQFDYGAYTTKALSFAGSIDSISFEVSHYMREIHPTLDGSLQDSFVTVTFLLGENEVSTTLSVKQATITAFFGLEV